MRYSAIRVGMVVRPVRDIDIMLPVYGAGGYYGPPVMVTPDDRAVVTSINADPLNPCCNLHFTRNLPISYDFGGPTSDQECSPPEGGYGITSTDIEPV